ncbi:MAG: 2-oxoacid:acceptor oxidoreductase family protein [Candidatus Izemoplasmataceae bacterium]
MKPNEEKLIVAGFGGQGVMLVGQILSYAATNEDLNTVWIPSYGPETRGGTANCSVTIAKAMINSPIITEPDSVIAMNLPSLKKFEPKLKKQGILIVNSSLVKDQTYRKDIKVIEVDANNLALKLGNIKVANMIMLGAYIKASNVFEKEAIFKVFKKIFTGNKEALIGLNQEALQLGMKLASQ